MRDPVIPPPQERVKVSLTKPVDAHQPKFILSTRFFGGGAHTPRAPSPGTFPPRLACMCEGKVNGKKGKGVNKALLSLPPVPTTNSPSSASISHSSPLTSLPLRTYIHIKLTAPTRSKASPYHPPTPFHQRNED